MTAVYYNYYYIITNEPGGFTSPVDQGLFDLGQS
jgi:hypothetical protein